MGKDQDLLDAARCGNFDTVERILNKLSKKSGPLASLRHGLGPNIQDSNGYTPLHHACLNGHKEIVALLLKWKALATIVDSKGCTPLHLAAWSGYTDIVVLLLSLGSSFPCVNQMNFDHESALHSAAQYGHTQVVKILLENRCYPSVRNTRNESPLDLASQYGRLEVVECLLKFHPGLLSDFVRCHSPLHLAAKNGHKEVVKLLLDSGFDIDYMTDIGTALHEAAMYGKLEVVKLLLNRGVDVYLENCRQRTVFDILGDINTAISKQIKDIIEDHITLIQLDNGSGIESEITPPLGFRSPDSENSFYDVPPLTSPLEDAESENAYLDKRVSSKRYSDPSHRIYQNTESFFVPSSAFNRSQPPAKPPRKSTSPSCEYMCRPNSLKSTPLLLASPSSSEADEICSHCDLRPKIYENSVDIEKTTDEHLYATVGPHREMGLAIATDDKCVSIETQPETRQFAGLRHGSTYSNTDFIPGRNRMHVERKYRNIYENVQITPLTRSDKAMVSGPNNIGNSLSGVSPSFDEKAEWAEIAGIMASFGGSIARDSFFSQGLETRFAQDIISDNNLYESPRCSTVDQWLSQLELSQYENLFILNGFDDINFLGCDILEEVDLEEIGIKNSAHIQRLVAAAKQLPVLQPIWHNEEKNCFPPTVDEWLKALNLSEYSETFLNNCITDMDRASKLWEVELNTVLKIPKLGHRKRILASLEHKQQDKSEESNVDATELASDFDDMQIKCDRSCEEIRFRMRSPSQLMKDSPENSMLRHQWRHHPDELVINSCNYVVKYLGSTLVRELRGLQSTKTSIRKLKDSTKDIGKIPSIILAISYLGVKFIDAVTQQQVCEHEIRNIHCACQDADDLQLFAYITKEHQTHNHYCHVFSSHSMEMASEIILTLGQAFEVAYQMVMRNKSERA